MSTTVPITTTQVSVPIPPFIEDTFKFINSGNIQKIIFAFVVLFTTVLGPSITTYVHGFWTSEIFRMGMLVLILLIIFMHRSDTVSIPPVAIVLLIFFISTQITKTQRENFDALNFNNKLEQFAPSEPLIDETFHISPEYFKENRDAPLDGTHADVPVHGKDDYVLYQETEHTDYKHEATNLESNEPIGGYDPLVGHEIAPF